jgi:hypothetical protein
VTDPTDSRYEKTYTTVGVQADLHFTVVHRLPMTLSVGFAKGYAGGERFDDEVMLSLKIL